MADHEAGRSWSLGHARWAVFDPTEIATSEAGLLLVRQQGSGGSAWALGSAEVWEGRHAFRFEISASQRQSGNLHIGVADGAAKAARMPGEPRAAGGAALSFHPWDGCLYAWEDWTVGHSSSELKNVMRGADLDGSATGAVVLLLVDMNARQMFISVNGGASVDVGVRLPESVRPFARLVHASDAIRLVEWRQEAATVATPVELLPTPSATAPARRAVAATATPSGLIAATQHVSEACRGKLSTAGVAECRQVEDALATLEEACATARGELVAAMERLATAAPYEMTEERARIDAAVAARAAAAPPATNVPQAVAAVSADVVKSVVHAQSKGAAEELC